MSDEPIRLHFSVAPIQSAMRRAHDGGARVVWDIPQSSMAELNRLMDMAVAAGGVSFVAMVLPLTPEEARDATERMDTPPKTGLGKWHRD